jgi:hypothetical protein
VQSRYLASNLSEPIDCGQSSYGEILAQTAPGAMLAPDLNSLVGASLDEGLIQTDHLLTKAQVSRSRQAGENHGATFSEFLPRSCGGGYEQRQLTLILHWNNLRRYNFKKRRSCQQEGNNGHEKAALPAQFGSFQRSK